MIPYMEKRRQAKASQPQVKRKTFKARVEPKGV
jgi:hypothetical protein